MIKLVLNTAIAYSIAIGLHAQVKVVNLRTEMLTNPQGIDVALPRLSWQLQSQQRHVVQTHYQIWVSHSKDGLMHGRQLVWNSGRQASSQSLHIPYGGPPLKSGMPYFWKVQVFTNKGAATVSENAYFTTGLLQPQDWMAQWIGMDNPSAWDSISQWSRLSARYLRKEFTANASIKRATVYICGLGMYQLVVNGQRIGNEVLAPNPTDYRKRVQYNTYDVTHALKTGTNAIGVVLGNGRFFTMRQNYKTQKHNNFGYPRLLLQLHIEYANGTSQTVVTDPTWKLNADGPIRTNNEYDGEEYDARKEFAGWTNAGFKDKDWSAAQVVEAPAGKLVAQMAPPMRVMQTIKPVSIKRVSEGRYMLDMGQNFAGWLMLKNLYGKAGHQVVLRFAESLQPNGELFTANLRDAKVTDIYTLKGTGNESWHPAFVYHGFRFVEISNFPGIHQLKQFEGHLIFDDLPSTGSFESGNTVLNQIFKNAWWGIASNYKGMPVDCPQRNERQPWLGDRTVGAQGESYLFGNAALYAKWMQDIEDSQTREGSIPDVAPAFWNYYTDDVTWPAAFIFISNHLYNQYADAAPIARHYAAMKKWMLYMQQKYMHNYLITRDKYADWCVPPESLELIHAKDSNRLTDGTLIATAYYYKLLQYMQRFALLTNHQPDAELYGQWADSIRIAFQQTFYNKEKRHYSNNTVTANLLPLMFGICPDAERAAVFEKIRHKIQVDNLSHIPTGLIGSQWLMRGLTDYGQTELAYTLASNNTYPSWGYMAAQGATTIWELWNGNTANPGMNSQNHVMLLGDLLTWYFENLAGIRSHKTEVGFKKIIMRPALPEGLPFVKATYQSVHGPITSHWKNTTHQFTWSVTIPANTSATLHFPAQDADEITEGGKPVTASPYIKVVKQEAGLVIMEIQNGQYHFVRHKKWKKGIVK
ncbi:MAG TPA: family 78 glycoside hydrolase catalytic domain, partial [Phnomibacter sp.]|nr:family 78 glycoside hydrolase catalytic domain [Phnomibacter sp.]